MKLLDVTGLQFENCALNDNFRMACGQKRNIPNLVYLGSSPSITPYQLLTIS
jgi:hypothetical protein